MLQKGRAFIKKEFPYFYRVVLGLIPKHVDGIGTMYVSSRMVLGIDMVWYQTLDVEVAAGCLLHEVMHVMRDLTRIAAMNDPELAPYAFDIPINDDLRKCGVKLPPWVVYSDKHKLPPGLTGEGYYHLLKKQQIQIPAVLALGSGKCGSCDGGSEDPAKNPNEPDELSDEKLGRSQQEVFYFKKLGSADVQDYVKRKGMQAGDIPGTWEEFLKFEDEEAIIPWQSIVPARLGESFGRISQGHSDYSLQRPSRRSFAYGWPRPGLISYSPNVWFIEDSSASMGHPMIKENRVETARAMQTLGLQDVWFIDADTNVSTKPRKISINELFTLPVTGRGGTDFRPAIELAMSYRPRPDLIIYSTDGCGEAPEFKPRNTEFVWLLAPGAWTQSPCDWGIQILTSNDPDERKQYTLLAA
jgi:predicted metal-dependent peptidase